MTFLNEKKWFTNIYGEPRSQESQIQDGRQLLNIYVIAKM